MHIRWRSSWTCWQTHAVPVGVGLGAMDMVASGDGDNELAYGLAAYQSNFGKPATVKDYTELIEHGKPLPGSVRATSMVPGRMKMLARKRVLTTTLTMSTRQTPSAKEQPRPHMPKWKCGKCNSENFYYQMPGQDPTVQKLCTKCKQLKKDISFGQCRQDSCCH